MDRSDRMRGNFKAAHINMDLFIDRLYDGLFTDRPDLRGLFPRDLNIPREHLANALDLIVENLENLDNLDEMEPMLAELGRRHRQYRVPCDAIEAFKTALCQTFYETVGCNWNEEHERDWCETIDRIWGAMFPDRVAKS